MATQTARIQDTILAMKRVLAKEKDPLDSDAEALKPTNRGNKLKRKAEYFHEGQLGGFRPYKRKIDHAGHSRYVLHTNPKRYDTGGYEIFDPSESDEEADEEAAEKNPYTQVHIEQLLMPLTQAEDLDTHPSLSLPYKSKILPDMVNQACDMLHKERRTLVDLKRLLRRLRGDHTFQPAGGCETQNDRALFGTVWHPDGYWLPPDLNPNGETMRAEMTGKNTALVEPDGAPQVTVNGKTTAGIDKAYETIEALPIGQTNGTNDPATDTLSLSQAEVANGEFGGRMEGRIASQAQPDEPDPSSGPVDEVRATTEEDTETKDTRGEELPASEEQENPKADATAINNASLESTTDDQNMTENPIPDFSKSSNPPTPSAISSPGHSPPPRMLTRGRANARNPSSTDPTSPAQESIPPSSIDTTLPIHPLYIPPPPALPIRNYGLPYQEALESRQIFTAWVQKQEEVCRGAEQLYEGLLKACRMRDTVWRWCRAEGHLGEMSDGEDWVDEEEWGLDGPLKKGMEEGIGEEVEQGKKTRNRRTAGG